MSRTDLPPRRRGPQAPPPKGLVDGEREPVLLYLPEEVRRNLQRPGSESALLWQTFYPFAHDGLSLRSWCSVRPLWGSPIPPTSEDRLIPYFWGLRVDGTPLEGLPAAAEAIAGRDDRLEIDLLLAGGENLIAVEAKTDAGPGRCGRYDSSRCPEVHGGREPCRYWEGGPSFSELLDFGTRPAAGADERPPCAAHYQLARTLLMVDRLGRARGLRPHLTLLVPRRRWPALQGIWLDFAERVRDEASWRRLRVVAWEDLAGIGRRESAQPRRGSEAGRVKR